MGLSVFKAFAVLAALAATAALAQQPPTVRLRGTIEKVNGHSVMAKSAKGDELKLNLADKVMVVEVVKASLADIKPGDFVGSGAMPQPDGTQKAIEVHIFPASMRGTGEGFRPWDHGPTSTMTNGTVGATVTGVSGPMLTVKYKDGEQKIMVPPDAPVVRFQIADLSAIKPGAPFAVLAAVKQSDGSFNVGRINVGQNGASPP
ncbi:MAG: hypothetical protein WB868_20725 [Xanthobacteraceae bacterium]